MKKVLTVAVMLALASAANAAIYRWDASAGDGLWTGANWTPMTFGGGTYTAGTTGQTWATGTNQVAWFTGNATVDLGGAAPLGTFSGASGSGFATGSPSAFWFDTASQNVTLTNGAINARYWKANGAGVTANLTLDDIALTYTGATGVDFGGLNGGTMIVNLGDLSNSTAVALAGTARFVVSSSTSLGSIATINGAIEASSDFSGTVDMAADKTVYTNGHTISLGNALYSGSSAIRNATVEGAGSLVVNNWTTTGTGGTAWSKAGTGTLVINGAFNINNAAGATFAVNAGKLVLNGNTTSDLTAVTVAAAGILGGTGVIGGNVTVDGSLELSTTEDLSVNGALVLGAASKLYLVGDLNERDLMQYSSVSGTFAEVYHNGVLVADPGTSLGLTYGATSLSVVPEPATLAVLALGGVAALIRRRK